ncbi:MAG: CRTAC1 family protein [Nannocystis sp.]|uniref:CRTAC1 family protein n=1 Tax=Nannocystis sp. TaxID=1962667 RepID=UPI002424BC09|nr:CRTAC1 family protein [Nannocystis sp.]MBK9753856.1 CRTAC1 family protein [Nannocystis sp.]
MSPPARPVRAASSNSSPSWGPLAALCLACNAAAQPGADTHAADTGGTSLPTTSDASDAPPSSSDPAPTDTDDHASDPGTGTGSAGSAGSASGGSGGTDTVDTEAPPPGSVRFTEVSAAAGLTYTQGEFHKPPTCLVDATAINKPGHFCTAEWYSGGVAVGDYDSDGHLDLFATRIYGSGVLLRGDGLGHFVDRTAEAGLDTVQNTNGAAWGDLDNDGDQDLYLTNIGGTRHYLFINDGAGHFSEEALLRGAGIESKLQHTGNTPALGDYDLDGYLDLYVGEYRTHLALGDDPSHARLLHNQGAKSPGHFEDVTLAAGVAIEDVHLQVKIKYPIAGVLALSPGFADLDDDGYPDLVITSDFGCSRLFWNQGDGSFLDGTVAAGVGTDENGMGTAIADFDGDGDLDIFVTSIAGAGEKTGNRMYRNDGDRHFSDATDFADVRDGGWGWGTAFLDHDNDADLDLVMTNGWNADLYLMDPMRLWDNQGDGTMLEISAMAGVTDDHQGRALVTLDHDEDGDQDLVVVNFARTPLLYRNDSDIPNGWLRVAARGVDSNRDGRGARVRVRIRPGEPWQVREIGGPSLFLGHSELVAHFGLGPGDDPVAELEVHFPATDETVTLENIPRNQRLTISEP